MCSATAITKSVMDSQNPHALNSAGRLIAAAMLFGIGYAVVRYHVAGGVPWKDLPFFILNKGISLSAFILLVGNFSLGPMNNMGISVPEGWLNARKAMGMTGFLLVLIHALMSFMLFNANIYGKFFLDNGTLTLLAGISMLAGVLAFVVLWAYNLSFQTFLREDTAFIGFITSRRFLLVAMIFGGAHLFFMGYEGWLKPSGWHGGMPPVSLVAFTFFVIGYAFNVLGRR